MCLFVEQAYVVADVVASKGFFVHVEVEKRHDIDVVEAEVPVGTRRRLFADGEGGIEQRTVFEELLEGILHFHNELFPAFVFAVDVEDGFPVGIGVAHVLAVAVVYVRHHLLSVEEGVEEVDEEFFVKLSAEYSLEAEVG